MRSGASCSARGRGCYVEIVHGDPIQVDFVYFEIIFGPPAFLAALALFFREKGDPGPESWTRDWDLGPVSWERWRGGPIIKKSYLRIQNRHRHMGHGVAM